MARIKRHPWLALTVAALLAAVASADVRTGNTGGKLDIFQIFDLNDGVYRQVADMTPSNTPKFNFTDNMVSIGGVAIAAPTAFTAYGAGAAYSLTNSSAAIDLGTTDPSITITTAGTYRITGRVKLTYTGATVAAETATIKLRRTNNTAADLTSGSETVDLPTATTLTHDWGWVPLDVYYTTANANDVITIFGNVSATLGAGTIQVDSCSIIAERIQ